MIDTKEREVIVLSGKAAWAESQAFEADLDARNKMAEAESRKREAESATREAESLRKIAEDLWAELEAAKEALRRERT